MAERTNTNQSFKNCYYSDIQLKLFKLASLPRFIEKCIFMKNKIIASLQLVGVEMHNASGLVNRHKKCNIFVFAVAYLYTDRIY